MQGEMEIKLVAATGEARERRKWKRKKKHSTIVKFFIIFQELLVGQVTQPERESSPFECSSH